MILPQGFADWRDALTLKRNNQPRVFELTEEEKYSVDEWAWLFLSLGKDYGTDYKKQAERKLSSDPAEDRLKNDINSRLAEKREINDILPDYDGTCRRKYGLAAWIPPSCSRLPKLVPGASWFFPLKALVLENYNRKIIEEPLNLDPALRQFPIRSRDKSGLSYLLTRESPFGYQTATTSSPSIEGDGIIWVAVDCSVPVKGQLAALRELAEQARHLLHGRNAIPTTDNYSRPRLVGVESSPEFEHMHFKFASGCGSSSDVGKVWFAVSVEVLGPLVKQFDELQRLLVNKHKELCQAGVAKTTSARLTHYPLPHVKGSHGGCQLKALHMVAQLALHGANTRDIVAILGLDHKTGRGYAYPWHQQFDENLDDFLETGLQIVRSEYRYLIHGQIKPTDAEGAD